MYNFDCADEEGAKEGSDREFSPSASTSTQAGGMKGTQTMVRKHRSSSQTTIDR